MDRFTPDRIFFGPAAAARPWLLMKVVLVLLAFDCWVDLSPHGGRYGIGDFNVAHFGWLDALTPTPSPGFYVGLISFCGLVALTIAIGGVNRWALGVLAAAYTFSWAMSMLDSYQHHYLLTLVLVAFVFVPAVDTRFVLGDILKAQDDETKKSPTAPKKKRKKRKQHEKHADKKVEERPKASASPTLPGGALTAWAYHATAIGIGIVYSYTALSKSEPEWRDGSALRNIAVEPMRPIHAYFVDERGLADETFWTMMGTSVIFLQILIAAGYFVAPLLDRGELRWPKWVCGAAFVGAMSFHLGAEYLELQIGWFSYYMIATAFVFLLPAVVVDAVVRLFAFASTRFIAILEAEEGVSARLAAVAVAAIVGLAGYAVDMPGVFAASLTFGALLIVFVFATRGTPPALPWVLGASLAALSMWLAFIGTEARWDYYRFVGGDHHRRGELEAALEAYIKANDYAPDDNDRHEREDEVRRALGMPPRWSEAE
jgi:hypothetical protein